MKDAVINALFGIREEYFSALFRDYRLKDRYGNIWDVQTVEFNEKWTILSLGLDGTENYSAVMISADGSTNELQEYEILQKTSE